MEHYNSPNTITTLAYTIFFIDIFPSLSLDLLFAYHQLATEASFSISTHQATTVQRSHKKEHGR